MVRLAVTSLSGRKQVGGGHPASLSVQGRWNLPPRTAASTTHSLVVAAADASAFIIERDLVENWPRPRRTPGDHAKARSWRVAEGSTPCASGAGQDR